MKSITHKIDIEVLLLKFKPIIRRMCAMCPEAWYIFIRSIQLCCLLLLCAVALLVADKSMADQGQKLLLTATSLNETAQASLLIAVVFSVIIEDVHTSSR